MSIERKNKPVMYWDWQRYWYRFLDITQGIVHRVMETPYARTVVPITATVLVLLFKATVQFLKWTVIASFIIGSAVGYVFIKMCLNPSGLKLKR